VGKVEVDVNWQSLGNSLGGYMFLANLGRSLAVLYAFGAAIRWSVVFSLTRGDASNERTNGIGER